MFHCDFLIQFIVFTLVLYSQHPPIPSTCIGNMHLYLVVILNSKFVEKNFITNTDNEINNWYLVFSDRKVICILISTAKDKSTLQKENKELKELTVCKICLDEKVCIVFLPCGHLVSCAQCSPAMRRCPICRTLVKGTVRTNLMEGWIVKKLTSCGINSNAKFCNFTLLVYLQFWNFDASLMIVKSMRIIYTSV